ncbi:MAG: GumC family protein [Gammaproteobacteria bacterium]
MRFASDYLLTGALRYKYRIFLGAVSPVLLVLLISALRPPQYVARTSFVLPSPTVGLGYADVGFAANIQQGNRLNNVDTATEILGSRHLKVQILTALGPEILYPEVQQVRSNGMFLTAKEGLQNILFSLGLTSLSNSEAGPMERALSRFEDSFAFQAKDNSGVMRVYFHHDDAQNAVNVLKVLLTFFSRKHVELQNAINVEFMRNQLDNYRQAVDEAEGAIQALSEHYGLFAPEEQVRLLLDKRDQLETGLNRTDTDIKKVQQEIASLKRALQQAPSTVTLYTDVQETVDAMDKTIRPQRRYLQKTVREGRNSAYDELDLEVRRLTARLTGLLAARDEMERHRGEVTRALPQLAEGKMKLHRLSRELGVREQSYEVHFASLEDSRIQENLNRNRISSIGVIQPPMAEIAPAFGLGIGTTVLIAGFVGFLASFLAALLYVYQRRALAVQESAEEQFGMPVLAKVPEKSARTTTGP